MRDFICEVDETGLRRLKAVVAEGLGKNRSFISQIANPNYSVPIPAGHIERHGQARLAL